MTIPAVLKLEQCFLLKPIKNFNELDNKLNKTDYPEIHIRLLNLDNKFTEVLELLDNIDKKKSAIEYISFLTLLYYELRTIGPWNVENCIEYSEQLNTQFKLHYGTTISKLFETTETVLNKQEIFDRCLQRLHKKLTASKFKKYPSLVEVYCLIVQNIKSYKVVVNPSTILPISLILIDDYSPFYKSKGLHCCKCILECLLPKDFADGNYYEVIYLTLKKVFHEKDVEMTKSLLECLKEFLRILPEDVQGIKTDELYAEILDQLCTESNLYRKQAMFDFMQYLMRLHKVNSVRRKKLFNAVICDNLDLCSNDGVEEILLGSVLESLKVWIQYCWCVWQLSTDQKILSGLFKCLYLSKNEANIEKIMHCLATLINLCSKEEKSEIIKNLDDCKLNSQFVERINSLRKYIDI